MTFQILTPTKAKLDDVRVLSQKNRQPDENPGVQLPMSMKLSNHILLSIDPALKPFLFTKAPGGTEPTATKRKDNSTSTLDGVEPVTDLPKLSGIGSHVKSLPWGGELTALKMMLSFATTNMLLDDCRIHRMRIKPQDGGTVELKFVLDAPNASETVFAKLAKYKSREIDVTVEQHEVAQLDIEDDDGDADDVSPVEQRKPAAAERAAVAKVAGGKAPNAKYHDAMTGETWSGRGLMPNWLKAAMKRGKKLSDFDVSAPSKSEARETAEAAFAATQPGDPNHVAWPFPKDAPGEAPPQSATTSRNPPQSRTARGRDKMKAALAKGAPK